MHQRGVEPRTSRHSSCFVRDGGVFLTLPVRTWAYSDSQFIESFVGYLAPYSRVL
jgi:hypothetical protein